MLHVVVVVDRAQVDRDLVEEVMSKVEAIGLESAFLSRVELGSELTVIDR